MIAFHPLLECEVGMSRGAGRSGIMLVEPSNTDERRWRQARRRGLAASAIRGVRWTAGVAVAVVGGGIDGAIPRDDIEVDPDFGTQGYRVEVLAGSLSGEPARRLLADGSSVLRLHSVTLAGTLSLPDDGVLWQPKRAGEREILISNEQVDRVVAGLPGHGILMDLADGTFGFRTTRRAYSSLVEALASRFS